MLPLSSSSSSNFSNFRCFSRCLFALNLFANADVCVAGADFDLESGETVRRTWIVLLPQCGTTTDLPIDSYIVQTMPAIS